MEALAAPLHQRPAAQGHGSKQQMLSLLLLLLLAGSMVAAQPPLPPQHAICLTFPYPTPSRGAALQAPLATLSACSQLGPVLQSVYVSWPQSYCSTQAPSNVSSFESPITQVYTCWHTANDLQFSAQLSRLWGATYPNVNPRFRSAVISNLASITSSGLILTIPEINLFVLTSSAANPRTMRLPVGATAALGSWFPLRTEASGFASPPPPFSGGVTLNSPPMPPGPPPGSGPCGGDGDLLEIQGMQLCVTSSRQLQASDDFSCNITATYVLRNIGTNLFPVAGLNARLSIMVWNGTATPVLGARDPYVIGAIAANFGRDTAISIGQLGRNMPQGLGDQSIPIVITINIQCNGGGSAGIDGLPPSCQCGALANIMLSSGSATTQCPAPYWQSKRSISTECFSPPTPTGQLHSYQPLSPSPDNSTSTCFFKALFTVTNRGGSAVTSIFGPLTVDLQWSMGVLRLAAPEQADNVTVAPNTTDGASLFTIQDMGSLMQPGQSAAFALAFYYSGTCADLMTSAGLQNLLALIKFFTSNQPVTTVMGVSPAAGTVPSPQAPPSSFIPYDDADVVDGSARCIYPSAILMGFNPDASTSYLYVAYPYALGSLPAFHGAFTRTFDANQRFSSPPSTTSTGDLTDLRIVTARVYVANVTGREGETYVCGLDLWTVPAGTTSGHLLSRPNYSLGCSLYAYYPSPQPIPTATVELIAPTNGFLGYFSGTDSGTSIRNTAQRRLQSLQAVWVTCSDTS